MKLVVIESPYAGNVAKNVAYARSALRHSLVEMGEFPFASHLLYTQEGVLNDCDSNERELGIRAGLAFGARADLTAVYIDEGVSAGMLFGVSEAASEGREICVRALYSAGSASDRASRSLVELASIEPKLNMTKGSWNGAIARLKTLIDELPR